MKNFNFELTFKENRLRYHLQILLTGAQEHELFVAQVWLITNQRLSYN